MTTRDDLISVLDQLDDERIDRLYSIAEGLRREQSPPAPVEDELTQAVPKRPFAAGWSAWDMVGWIDTDGPTDMGADKYKHFARVYGDSPDE